MGWDGMGGDREVGVTNINTLDSSDDEEDGP
jgi:hypothetical protein